MGNSLCPLTIHFYCLSRCKLLYYHVKALHFLWESPALKEAFPNMCTAIIVHVHVLVGVCVKESERMLTFGTFLITISQAQTPASSLMPPPSAPLSHSAASHSLPSPSPGPSSAASSSYTTPSTMNPASPQTPMSTAENAGIVPQLQ